MTKNNKAKINIMVVTHKPAFIVDNPFLKSIQVGTNSDNKIENMDFYDDDGDNISEKNKSYCELTATYWAWKNLKSDYYGLFHYRRYLSFAKDSSESEYAGRAFPTVSSALNDINLDEKAMRKIIEGNDFVVPKKESIKNATGYDSIYSQYKNEHYIEDLDYCLDYIEEKYPDIHAYSDALSSDSGYFCNMFIMKKEIFNEYCSFIFDVLGNFEENNDFSNYSMQQYRVTGYIAERLTNIFIHYLIGQDKYKYKELQIAFFENTDKTQEVEPISEDSVNIALAANDYYSPYISTLIRSIADSSDNQRMYDIVIFHQDITGRNQELLLGESSEYENINIRFYDMAHRTSEYSDLDTKSHITIETYFRLFIPEIMKKYSKVLYLDGDMIVKKDIAKLFDENIDEYMLAACRDVDMAGVYNSNLIKSENTIDSDRKEYIDKVIKLDNPYDYLQAGVLLMNLDNIRSKFSTNDFLKLANSRDWVYMDQDILNNALKGKIKYLDLKWNVLYDWEFERIKNVISKSPTWLYGEYLKSRKDPFIIHYGGSVKPWQRADTDFAVDFWNIAKKSVFYEVIISRMSEWVMQESIVDLQNHIYAPEKLRLTTRIARKLRAVADKIMPVGSIMRKPLTALSRLIKRIIY